MSEWLLTQRLVIAVTIVFLCYGAVLDWLRAVDERHERPLALCVNYDSVRVVRHHWIPERSRVLRTDPAPPCEVAK